MALSSIDGRLLVQVLLLCGLPFLLWSIPRVKTAVPLVIMQMAVGIVVGPSVLGIIIPDFEDWVFQSFAPFPGHALKGASFWGSLMFVFYTGLHIDKEHFLGEHASKQFWIISLTSLFMPLLLGCFAGWIFIDYLYGDYLVGKGSRATYILSLGISAGVTALPVLSAILLEVGKMDSDLGKFMIAAATVHDILLWLLVTVLFGLVDSPENWAGKYQPVASLLLVLLFIVFLVKVFLPNATKVVAAPSWLNMAPVNRLLVTITCMALSGLVTDMLQVHTLVGIVAFGACTPEAERPFILSHVEVMNRALLLPLFFGSAGLKVYLNRASPAVGGIFLGLTAAGLIGQIFGCIIPAYYLYGRNLKRANIMFSYMISKGVVQIVVAATLLDKGLIDDDTYSAMILMALVCTALTKPLVLMIDKFSFEKGDAYSFSDLHLSTSGITETLRRASRMVYGTELPAEWTLPAMDAGVILEGKEENDQRAHHDVAAATTTAAAAAAVASREQVASKPPADPAAAFRAAYFWHTLSCSTTVSALKVAGHPDGAANAPVVDVTSSSPSGHAQGHHSSNFRQISKSFQFDRVSDLFPDDGDNDCVDWLKAENLRLQELVAELQAVVVANRAPLPPLQDTDREFTRRQQVE